MADLVALGVEDGRHQEEFDTKYISWGVVGMRKVGVPPTDHENCDLGSFSTSLLDKLKTFATGTSAIWDTVASFQKSIANANTSFIRLESDSEVKSKGTSMQSSA